MTPYDGGESVIPLQVGRTRAWGARSFGVGTLVAAGYMDPGNWATDMQGGAAYGYQLLWVVLAASLVAMLVQWVAARVGLVTGKGLAELCRDELPRWAALSLWVVAEVAIIACDVAETVGTAVALSLLLQIPLWSSVLLSAALLVGYFSLEASNRPRLERAMALTMVAVAVCLGLQLMLARPDWTEVARGFVPSADLLHHKGMLWISVGIVGATVMPHNLFLHSSMVSRGAHGSLRNGLRKAGTEVLACLSFAMLVNIGLLLLAAAAFPGSTQSVGDLAQAQRMLTPALGATWPGVLFAFALLCCGLNSMVSGTWAGQIIVEGFLDIRLSKLRRALITRGIALGPALMVVQWWGGSHSTPLLVGSQVVLSLSLPFALLPLLVFASRSRSMREFRLKGLVGATIWTCAGLLTALNVLLVAQAVGSSG